MENTVYFKGTKCFGMYFFRVTKSPKLSIFLGLGLSSTFGPPRHILIGVPPGYFIDMHVMKTLYVTVK